MIFKEHSIPDMTLSHTSGDGEIITATGRWFNVLDPRPEDIDIEDIVSALSNQCRFTGHTREFYSVAQHSVLVAKECPPKDAMYGLLHDASEAYLSDIARPVKRHPAFRAFYQAAEKKLQDAIYTHFGLDPDAVPLSVHEADNVLLRTEARDLMPDSFPVYPGDTLTEEIIPWTPQRAKAMFIGSFFEYFKGD